MKKTNDQSTPTAPKPAKASPEPCGGMICHTCCKDAEILYGWSERDVLQWIADTPLTEQDARVYVPRSRLTH
jgi:hypothetical protein